MLIRKTILTAMAAITLAGTAAACGSTEPKEPPSGGTGSSPTASPDSGKDKTYKITMYNLATFNPNAPVLPREQDPVRQMIEKAMNIDLEMMIVPEQASAKLNTLIASGEVPDLIYFGNRTTSVKYYEQGVTAELDDYLKNAPALVQHFGPSRWEPMRYKGKTIGIPGTEGVAGINGLWIRNDWLNSLNLKVPTTPEELFEVMKAFTFNDPDRNGKNDTYGFAPGITKEGTLANLGWDQMFWMFGVNPGNFDVVDNKLVSHNLDPRMKEAVAYANKLLSEKVVDPDWVTLNTVPQVQDKLFKGRSGVVVTDWRSMEPGAQQKMKETIGEVPDWIVIPPMKGPHGDQINSYDVFQNAQWAVSKKAAGDPGKVQRIVDLLQYMYTDKEAYKTIVYGIKDVTWKETNGKPEMIALDSVQSKNYEWLGHYRFPRRANDDIYFNFKNPKTVEYHAINRKYLKPNNVMPYIVLDPNDVLAQDREKYWNEMLLKFMTGKEPLAKWEEFVGTLNAKFKAGEQLEKVTRQLKEQGIIR
ncbi:extracellular solute-binding protein [Paenibacillus flagellatus]|nr:extracellular solute-binding protein [Paenibacillus flagellatus]